MRAQRSPAHPNPIRDGQDADCCSSRRARIQDRTSVEGGRSRRHDAPHRVVLVLAPPHRAHPRAIPVRPVNRAPGGYGSSLVRSLSARMRVTTSWSTFFAISASFVDPPVVPGRRPRVHPVQVTVQVAIRDHHQQHPSRRRVTDEPRPTPRATSGQARTRAGPGRATPPASTPGRYRPHRDNAPNANGCSSPPQRSRRSSPPHQIVLQRSARLDGNDAPRCRT